MLPSNRPYCFQSSNSSSAHKSSSSSKRRDSSQGERDKERKKEDPPSEDNHSHRSSSGHKSSRHRTHKAMEDVKKHRGLKKNSRRTVSSESEVGDGSERKATLKGNVKTNPIVMDSEEDMADVDISFTPEVDLSDEDQEAECLRIFHETQSLNHEDKEDGDSDEGKSVEPSKTVQVTSVVRKRLAHDPAIVKVEQTQPKARKLSLSQHLHHRYQSLLSLQKDSLDRSHTAIDRKRVAHAPSAALVAAAMQAKGLIRPSSSVVTPPVVTPPVAQPKYSQRVSELIPAPHATNHVHLKGSSRMAHNPKLPGVQVENSAAPPRPLIPPDPRAKVPLNVRQRYLNLIIDHLIQVCGTYEESYKKSMEEEVEAYRKSSNKKVYLNVVANILTRLKRLNATGPAATNQKAVVSHADVLNGPKAKKTSYSIETNRFRRNISVDIVSLEQFYEHLSEKYVVNSTQLESMGYPRPHSHKGGFAQFCSEQALAVKEAATTNARVCRRCGKEYRVDDKGWYKVQEECTYHFGKNWKKRVAGAGLENRYTCCEGDSGSDGCSLAKGHVFENPVVSEDKGYIQTLPAAHELPFKARVYALDCEMIYTTKGTELARVTVVDMNLKSVYETLVKPENPVLDYNTRFSGLKMEHLEKVTTSIYQVQAVLLSMITEDTVLIGHSLESDLKALKLIHSTVVDTSLVFPHKRGLPYKRALKNLAAEYCNKIIQNGVDGHDSAEDAIACMELMICKVKQDLKSE